MHNRPSSQAYEYDAEFLLKALASLFVVSVSITLIYHRNYLLNYAGQLKARFFGAKPTDTAPPPSVPYQTIKASLAPAILGEIDDKQKPSSGSDSDVPTNPTPSAEAASTPATEVKATDQKEESAPDQEEDFVDVEAAFKQGKLEDEKEKPQAKEQEPEAVSTPRLR
jgi:hypothetical protein